MIDGCVGGWMKKWDMSLFSMSSLSSHSPRLLSKPILVMSVISYFQAIWQCHSVFAKKISGQQCLRRCPAPITAKVYPSLLVKTEQNKNQTRKHSTSPNQKKKKTRPHEEGSWKNINFGMIFNTKGRFLWLILKLKTEYVCQRKKCTWGEAVALPDSLSIHSTNAYRPPSICQAPRSMVKNNNNKI